MKLISTVLVIVLTSGLLSSSLSAESGSKTEQKFSAGLDIGLKLADEERYPEAFQLFQKLFKSQEEPQKAYLALFLACKALERMGEYQQAEQLIKKHQKRIPAQLKPDFLTLQNSLSEQRLALGKKTTRLN